MGLEGVTSGDIATGDTGGSLGYDVDIEQSRRTDYAACKAVHDATTVTDPNNDPVTLSDSCSTTPLEGSWQAKNDPPLGDLGHFGLKLDNSLNKITGTYKIQSNGKVWVVDSGEEVGGIVAAGAMFFVGLIIAIVGLILSCVGC